MSSSLSHSEEEGKDTLSSPEQNVTVMSFGYLFGVPKVFDKLFDLRNFPCPSLHLCQSTDGTSKKLQDDILHRPVYVKEIARIVESIHTYAENHPQSIIVIGCEEGRHRSVAVVERVYKELTSLGLSTSVKHRDLLRKKERLRKEKEIKDSRKMKYQLYEED